MGKKILFFILAVLLILPVFSSCGEQKETLNILNWGDYMDPDIWTAFEDEYNVSINYITCPSNEEMYATVSTEDSQVDIIFPSDYLVERMIGKDMLHEINYDNIPNAKNIMDFCKNRSFDSDNKYSVPYTWGTLGILYDTTKVDGEIDSWSVLWDQKYSGEIYMYDSARDSIGVALLKLGYSINTRDNDALAAAKQALIDQKPLVKAYGTDDIRGSLVNGSGTLGVVYSGDAVLAMNENPDLAYCIPKEGSNVWFDNVTIMKNSKHTELAEKFINYLLDINNAAKNSYYIGYPCAVDGAVDLIDETYKDEEDFTPYKDNYAYDTPAADLARCTVFSDLGEYEQTYLELWMSVRTS